MPGDVVFVLAYGVLIGFGIAFALGCLLVAACLYAQRRRWRSAPRPRPGTSPAAPTATVSTPGNLLTWPEWPVDAPGSSTQARRMPPPRPDQSSEGS